MIDSKKRRNSDDDLHPAKRRKGYYSCKVCGLDAESNQGHIVICVKCGGHHHSYCVNMKSPTPNWKCDECKNSNTGGYQNHKMPESLHKPDNKLRVGMNTSGQSNPKRNQIYIQHRAYLPTFSNKVNKPIPHITLRKQFYEILPSRTLEYIDYTKFKIQLTDFTACGNKLGTRPLFNSVAEAVMNNRRG
eukprot:TRINITY_DN1578_c1_g1_i1.p1 TRINITY_DN1578_c1_g1~~TRINITY_DN1578_c1_g1_i1.p1  ORF type:complete len:189 (+),score=25.50 TRINITY_DN1578_c1_g1_i1:239-805(+)